MRATIGRNGGLRCGFLVAGAGITGAQVAEKRVRHGHDMCVVDRERPGLGSTRQYGHIQSGLEHWDRGGADATMVVRPCAGWLAHGEIGSRQIERLWYPWLPS